MARMNRFDLVVFDCDGVVVDSEVLSCQCLAEVFTDFGVPMSIEVVFDEFLGRSFPAVEAYYARAAGHPLPTEFRATYRERLLALFASSLQPVPAIENVLANLPIPYCLASSSDDERLATTLAVSGLRKYFGERVFNAAMVKRGKPAPDLFLLAAARMGADPHRTLVVEDTVPGIAAAKAAGMTAWGFVGGSHFAGKAGGRGAGLLAEAGADRVFASMADFVAEAIGHGA
jgi:HAD superfamily hydrolase (TIGR01509 family)